MEDISDILKHSRTIKSEAWRGFVSSMPVAIGVIPMALLLGAQAAQNGLSIGEVPMMTEIKAL